MMSCEKIQEMISSMLDGELEAKEINAIEEHIAHCDECAAMYKDFAALSSQLKEDLAQVPATLHKNIMKGVLATRKKPLLISLRPYLSAAACLVIVVAAVFATRNGASYDMAMPAAPAAHPSAIAEAHMEYSIKTVEDNFEIPAEPAPTPLPAAPAEPAAAPEPATGLEPGMSLYGLASYEPGAPIDEAWFIDYTGEAQMQRILFPEILSELLTASETKAVSSEAVSSADVIVRLRTGDTFTTLKLYFVDDNIIVETSEGFYVASGTPEEFLSINNYTHS